LNFDEKQRTSWKPEGETKEIVLAAEDQELEGAMRDVVHEYPHVPGGDPEKLGRRNAVVRMTVDFAGVYPGQPELGAGAWEAGTVEKLLMAFDEGKTGDLVSPLLPRSIKAYCRNWSLKLRGQITSGGKATFVFAEHSKRDHLFDAVERAGKIQAMETRLDVLHTERLNVLKNNIFDDIDEAINVVLSVRDTVEAYDILIRAKIERLQWLFQEADDTVEELRDPENWAIYNAFLSLWETIVDLGNDITGKSIPLGYYTTPHVMTIHDLSAAIFGDATHTGDLRALNDIPDELEIRAGTRITYYQEDG
jgi:hypothetical protein